MPGSPMSCDRGRRPQLELGEDRVECAELHRTPDEVLVAWAMLFGQRALGAIGVLDGARELDA